eukprot:1140379-Pelagomonas_calceolata.AAC.3
MQLKCKQIGMHACLRLFLFRFDVASGNAPYIIWQCRSNHFHHRQCGKWSSFSIPAGIEPACTTAGCVAAYKCNNCRSIQYEIAASCVMFASPIGATVAIQLNKSLLQSVRVAAPIGAVIARAFNWISCCFNLCCDCKSFNCFVAH